jgi:hypothetical protein
VNSTLLLPLLLLIVVVGAVVMVALIRARPEDVPSVLQEAGRILRRVAGKLPTPHTEGGQRRRSPPSIDSPDTAPGGEEDQ